MQNHKSFWQYVKESFKSKNDSSKFPWFQSGLILVGFTLGAFAAASVDVFSRKTTSDKSESTISEADVCKEKGGTYDSKNSTCILVTSDKGNDCSSNSECDGWCLADFSDTIGENKNGICSETFALSGCVKFIDNGKVNEVCIN